MKRKFPVEVFKRSLIILLICFFSQQIIFLPASSATDYSLLQAKINSGYPDGLFGKIFGMVCFGVDLYIADAIKHHNKQDLISEYEDAALSRGIGFDFGSFDIKKKGYTRYYPFLIGGKSFILRIFLTDEKCFQPEMKVLYEGSIENPAVTFQVLPSLNEILADCKIKPRPVYSPETVTRSP